MSIRSVLILAAVGTTALASSAWASGGCYGPTCYRHVVQPPLYGVVSQQVMVQPPQVYARAIPGEYASFSEKVLVSPPRKVWQVTRDAYGQAIGCWVMVPAQYAVQHRRVMVRPPQVVQEATPAVYGTVNRKVLVQPARSGWEPIGGGYGAAGYGGGYASAGYGYGGYSAGAVGAVGVGLSAASGFLPPGPGLAAGVVGAGLEAAGGYDAGF